jgi:hypothetical protein
MPRLATVKDPALLALMVKNNMQRFRFLAAVTEPRLSSTHVPDIFLYGSAVSCTEALIEALQEHPGCERFGEYEYLPAHVLTAMKQQIAKDPLTKALQDLGEVKPRATH